MIRGKFCNIVPEKCKDYIFVALFEAKSNLAEKELSMFEEI